MGTFVKHRAAVEDDVLRGELSAHGACAHGEHGGRVVRASAYSRLRAGSFIEVCFTREGRAVTLRRGSQDDVVTRSIQLDQVARRLAVIHQHLNGADCCRASRRRHIILRIASGVIKRRVQRTEDMLALIAVHDLTQISSPVNKCIFRCLSGSRPVYAVQCLIAVVGEPVKVLVLPPCAERQAYGAMVLIWIRGRIPGHVHADVGTFAQACACSVDHAVVVFIVRKVSQLQHYIPLLRHFS